MAKLGRSVGDGSLSGMIAAMDGHLGTPGNVIASLQADSTLTRATDLAVQVHSIDPPHPFILRSIELVAEEVAPALGWGVVTELAASCCHRHGLPEAQHGACATGPKGR